MKILYKLKYLLWLPIFLWGMLTLGQLAGVHLYHEIDIGDHAKSQLEDLRDGLDYALRSFRKWRIFDAN